MLHGAVLRSPYAHARIVSIDTSAAEAHPKVRAVITGKVLETLKLAWMPTLSMDVQSSSSPTRCASRGRRWRSSSPKTATPLATPLELIEVEYEALDPVIDARKALNRARR